MKFGLSSLPEIRWPLSRLANVQGLASLYGRRFLQLARTRVFAILLYAVLASSVLTAVVLNVKIVQVVDGSGTRTIYTFRSDPGAILRQSGIHLSKEDRYAFTGIKNHYGRINFFAAFPVQVTSDGKTQEVMAATGTVTDVLKKAGVHLSADDTINVKPEQAVARGLHIVVARVRFETNTVQNPIPYQTQVTQDATLVQGTRNVLAAGQNGVETVTLRLKYVDGKMVEQVETGRSVTPPVNEQVVVGTVSPLNLTSGSVSTKTAKSTTPGGAADGVPGSYSKVFTGLATAYTQAQGTQTATGQRVAKGLVAVNPNKIPYGTKLYIATPDHSFVYGSAVAADTGGFVTNGSGVLTDLFFPTEAQCQTFGKRTVNIYVLN
ncbi:MAG: G5 domain-containing protein [Ethanoligenens sp.]